MQDRLVNRDDTYRSLSKNSQNSQESSGPTQTLPRAKDLGKACETLHIQIHNRSRADKKIHQVAQRQHGN